MSPKKEINSEIIETSTEKNAVSIFEMREVEHSSPEVVMLIKTLTI